MKTLTKKTFLDKSSNPSLAAAVIRQMGGWTSFKESAPDISRHGIDGGFNGFIYTRDTVKFSRRNRNEIAELAKSQAADFGKGVLEMIAGFNCLKNQGVETEEIGRALWGTGADDTILNALAWYAGEEISRNYCDLTGENN